MKSRVGIAKASFPSAKLTKVLCCQGTDISLEFHDDATERRSFTISTHFNVEVYERIVGIRLPQWWSVVDGGVCDGNNVFGL